MRLLLFHPFQEFYGSDKIFFNIVKCLYEKHDLTIVLKGDSPLENLFLAQIPKVKIYKVSFLPKAVFSYLSIKYIISYLFENLKFLFFFKYKYNFDNYDYILINTLALPTIPLIASIYKCKTLLYCHEYLEGKFLSALVYSFNCRFANSVICVSDVSKFNLPDYIKDHTKVLHNGIDFGPGYLIKKTLSHEINLLYVGRLSHKKGIFSLINNLAHIKHLRFNLKVIGEPFHTQKHIVDDLQKMIYDLGLNNKITLLGYHDNVNNFIEESTFVVVPSLYNDPFPTTVLESFSLSTPVIATMNGGQSEIIVSNHNGFLYNANCLDSFQRIFKNISELNCNMYKKMSKNAFNYYNTNLTYLAYKNKFDSIASCIFSR